MQMHLISVEKKNKFKYFKKDQKTIDNIEKIIKKTIQEVLVFTKTYQLYKN